MRHINGIYTQRYNRAHKTDGSLFRGRYKSILVEADSYLLELIRYIHRNPLRTAVVDSLDIYPWSSHHGYVSDASEWNWLYKDFVLSLFSPNKGERRKKYRSFVSQDDREEVKQFYSQEKGVAVLGKEAFISWLKETFSEKKRHGEIPESRLFLPDVKTIKESVCVIYDVNENQLLKSKRGTSNVPRNIAIYLARYLRGDSLKDIGREFGIDNYSSVSSIMERMKREISIDPNIKEQVEMAKKRINKSHEQT